MDNEPQENAPSAAFRLFCDTKVFLQDILFTLFPRACPLCHKVLLKESEPFCPDCFSGFHLIHPPLCICCGEPLPGTSEFSAFLCQRCLLIKSNRQPPLTVRSAALYSGNMRKAILRVKYGGHLVVAASLGLFLKQQVSRFFPMATADVILPVPLHPKRLRQREFNQCTLLARPLVKSLDIVMDLSSVTRIRNTPSQSASGSAKRQKNLQDAFRVIRPSRLKGKSVLIVDDVYTTGATLEALGKALYAAGAAKVSAFTLARSPQWAPAGFDRGRAIRGADV